MNKIYFREIENSKCRGEREKRKRREREWRDAKDRKNIERIIVWEEDWKVRIMSGLPEAFSRSVPFGDPDLAK